MSEEFIEQDENSSEDASPRERRSRLQAGPEAGTRSRLLRNPAKGEAATRVTSEGLHTLSVRVKGRFLS